MRGLIRVVLPLVLVAAAGAGAAMATTAATHTAGTVKLAKTASFGSILVDASGRTIYRYTPDRKGVNTCTGQCATYWPALLVKATAKPVAGAGVNKALLGTIKAAHGMRQVTYAGFPLYRYKGDSKAGQLKGQGTDGSWYVVNAKGAMVKNKVSGSGGTTTTAGTTTSKGGWG